MTTLYFNKNITYRLKIAHILRDQYHCHLIITLLIFKSPLKIGFRENITRVQCIGSICKLWLD
jgi:hypothetical protein